MKPNKSDQPLYLRRMTSQRCGGIMRTVCDPRHLKRTLLISFIVGSWLVLFNLGDVFLHGDVNFNVWVKLALDYLTPFVVANMGLLSHEEIV